MESMVIKMMFLSLVGILVTQSKLLAQDHSCKPTTGLGIVFVTEPRLDPIAADPKSKWMAIACQNDNYSIVECKIIIVTGKDSDIHVFLQNGGEFNPIARAYLRQVGEGGSVEVTCIKAKRKSDGLIYMLQSKTLIY